MLKLPLVSFVVTSYNYARFIEQTLDSIKSQTYDNFEIIVVDDFSSDNSVEIIEKFIQYNQDLRITLIKHDDNQGQLASMLDGLKISNGVLEEWEGGIPLETAFEKHRLFKENEKLFAEIEKMKNEKIKEAQKIYAKEHAPGSGTSAAGVSGLDEFVEGLFREY